MDYRRSDKRAAQVGKFHFNASDDGFGSDEVMTIVAGGLLFGPMCCPTMQFCV